MKVELLTEITKLSNNVDNVETIKTEMLSIKDDIMNTSNKIKKIAKKTGA